VFKRAAPDIRTNSLMDLNEPIRDFGGVLPLFRFAEQEAIAAIDWYLLRRRFPAACSRFLRATATMLGILGTITPLAHAVSPRVIEPELGYVLLASGAGCILFDRIFGFSASWARYIRAELEIQGALKNAQAKWISALSRASTPLSKEDLKSLLSIIIRLRTDVHTILEDEAASWVGYLTEAIEELTASRGRISSMPALQLSVSSDERKEAPGS